MPPNFDLETNNIAAINNLIFRFVSEKTKKNRNKTLVVSLKFKFQHKHQHFHTYVDHIDHDLTKIYIIYM